MLRRLRSLLGCLIPDADIKYDVIEAPTCLQLSAFSKLLPPPPSPSTLPLAAGSLRSFQPPRSMQEALEALEAQQHVTVADSAGMLVPPAHHSSERGGCGGSAPEEAKQEMEGERRRGKREEVCRAFAAGQHRRKVTPLQHHREQQRLEQEKHDHFITVAALDAALQRRGSPVVASDAMHAFPQALAGEQQLCSSTVLGSAMPAPAADAAQAAPPPPLFKLGPLFQTRAGSGAAATQLVPLHGMQLAARAQVAAEATAAAAAAASATRGTSPAAAAAAPTPCPAAAHAAIPPPAPVRPALPSGSIVHSSTSQLAQLDSEGSGGSTAGSPAAGRLWAAASCNTECPACRSKGRQVIELMAQVGTAWSRREQCAAVSAELPAEAAERFEAFVQGMQHQQPQDGGSSKMSITAASCPLQHGGPATLVQVPSLQTLGSQEALLPHNSEGYSIPAAHASSSATSSTTTEHCHRQQQGLPLLSAWRQALQSRLPSRGSTLRAAAGWVQKKEQEGVAEAAEDVHPKAGGQQRRWELTPRASADENAPMLQ